MKAWEFTQPKGWEIMQRWGDGYALRSNGLRVIVDCEPKNDGSQWLHVSVSRAGWTPSHADMHRVKNDFIGNRYAYSVWPPEDQYVNIHAHCLHLWARWDETDGRVLPEFSAVLPGIGRSI
jgi:hypothetical protein